MALVLEVSGDLRAALKGKQSALRSLGRLERMVAEGQSPPTRLLKPSGTGSAGEFAPYRVLRLHHAKLDFSGQNKGDPLLVFQETSPGRLVALALTDHRAYASSDPARCRAWLWMHRDAIDWSAGDEAAALLEQLRAEFEHAAPLGGRGRR
ncbi:hypothetical protein ABZT49_00975 [Methylobacterium sp. EM32]|uniref:hypothetical protein n=1 Tax=Methylobacterium sp. EM32 TaxID=3163481 RepID=UPI0033B26FD1